MIKYVLGDATNPEGSGVKIIAHVCNDLGLWGSGFVLAVSNRWSEPEEAYRRWALGSHEHGDFGLGHMQLVKVTDWIYVANMVAQRGVRNGTYDHPLKYTALKGCLKKLDYTATAFNASVHMPRIGCGLAGGKWDVVESIINDVITVPVTVYDLE